MHSNGYTVLVSQLPVSLAAAAALEGIYFIRIQHQIHKQYIVSILFIVNQNRKSGIKQSQTTLLETL